LLFRETSAVVCAYGSRLLVQPVLRDIYVEKYKGVSLILQALTCALSGGYVNFGVFALYDDKALQNAMDVSLQLCLQIPTEDVMTYMKLSRAYFGYLEVLFSHHLDVMCGLDSAVFNRLVKTVHEGLQSSGKL
jgi:exportin-7